MIKVYGKIESLKKIRSVLLDRGLKEFNSTGEISRFILTYDSKVRKIRETAEQQIAKEIEELVSKKQKLDQQIVHLRKFIRSDAERDIVALQNRIAAREPKEGINYFFGILNTLSQKLLKFRYTRLENSVQKRIVKATHPLHNETQILHTKINKHTSNRLGLVELRIMPELEKLEYAKQVINEINPLIAGAIGERKVEEELKNLSLYGVLINDFSVKFNPPIYYKKDRERIYSVQIDHLLITGAGIFVIETKNWSKKSIENLDLRSPVAQVRRSSYATFVIVNSIDDRSLGVKEHHWGNRQIPVRNLIVMINHKPKVRFKFVTVKTLNELNRYVEYFEPIFTPEEVDNIADYLRANQPNNFRGNLNRNSSRHRFSSSFIRDNNKTINDCY